MANDTPVRLDQQLTASFEIIAPDMAEAWLGKNIGNRNIRSAKVATIARDITAGDFAITGEAIKFDWNGRLIDGQHRLHAVMVAGRPITSLVVRGLAPGVQAVLDVGAKRSAADALRMRGSASNNMILAASIRQLLAWERGQLVSAASNVPEPTHSEVMEWYKAHADDIESCGAAARGWYKALRLWPGTLTTAIYLTSMADPQASHRFFKDMADLSLNPGADPRRDLMKRLREADDRNERMHQSRQLFYVLQTWNAWRRGLKRADLSEVRNGKTRPIPEPK